MCSQPESGASGCAHGLRVEPVGVLMSESRASGRGLRVEQDYNSLSGVPACTSVEVFLVCEWREFLA